MKNPLQKLCVEHHVIERAVFVGPQSQREEVMQWLDREGWRFVQSGPYTDKKMWPAVDPDRFKFIVERPFNSEQTKHSPSGGARADVD